MAEPHTFADRLHVLCTQEAIRSSGCPDASAALVTEIIGAAANAIALMTLGNEKASQTIVALAVESLPPAVEAKCAFVRSEFAQAGEVAGHVR